MPIHIDRDDGRGERSYDGIDTSRGRIRRIYVNHNDGRGEVLYFEDPDAEPSEPGLTIETRTANEIDDTSARLHGALVGMTGVDEVTLWFRYRQPDERSWAETVTQTVSEPTSYSVAVGNLEPNTEYEWHALGEAVSTVTGETVRDTGDVKTFTTIDPGVATVQPAATHAETPAPAPTVTAYPISTTTADAGSTTAATASPQAATETAAVTDAGSTTAATAPTITATVVTTTTLDDFEDGFATVWGSTASWQTTDVGTPFEGSFYAHRDGADGYMWADGDGGGAVGDYPRDGGPFFCWAVYADVASSFHEFWVLSEFVSTYENYLTFDINWADGDLEIWENGASVASTSIGDQSGSWVDCVGLIETDGTAHFWAYDDAGTELGSASGSVTTSYGTEWGVWVTDSDDRRADHLRLEDEHPYTGTHYEDI